MSQQLSQAFEQALSIVSRSPAAMFVLAAGVIYLAFTLLGKFKGIFY